ncbi:FAD-dependent oxidoreductase [Bacillus marinisedimentorum]|uniref:FAD-dependent oxidoreductase n=1 Tax=Bacillus marinisedimentorum TaxID=1821260 RepID=UPI00087238E4|nr:FAD-dependent oxidoreductase [Bacillus marinisedimentorum]
MKVAIMGAGLAGLSCAVTLEKFGITPHVFEKRGQVGDRFVMSELILSMMHPPIKDSIRYLAEEHQLYIRPVSNLSTLWIHSPNESVAIRGNLGFINVRGKHPDAFEKQLASDLKVPITFHSENSYEKLLREYTHIILATGDAAYTEKIQQLDVAYTTTLRGMTVSGTFKRTEGQAWFDNRFAPKGMGYLLPFSDTKAMLVLAYPEYPEIKALDEEKLWKTFIHTAKNTLNQKLEVVDSFHINNYIVGKSGHARIGNTFFTGNCFGGIMPFMGFGQFESMLTGIYAAYDLAGKGNYDDLTAPLKESYRLSLTLRHAIEQLDNAGLDKLVRSLKNPAAQKILLNDKLHSLKWAARFVRMGQFLN